MGYELKCDELNELVSVSNKVISAWVDELEDIGAKLESIASTDAMTGETANSIKSYISEVHLGCMLPFIENMLRDFIAKLAVYDYGYNEIDSDYHKHLHEEAIQGAREKYSADRMRECEEMFGQTLGSVSDIIEIGNPQVNEIGNDCARIRYRLERLQHDISQHESDTKSSGTNELRELIESVSSLVREGISRPASGVLSYSPRDYFTMSGLQGVCENTRTSILYQRRNSATIEAAGEYETKTASEIAEEERKAAELEAKKKENRDKGFAEMLGAGVLMLGGTAAIVLSGGIATPLVVGGGMTLAFGTADAIEGVTQLATGTDRAMNPLRDTLFVGNDFIYGMTESGVALMTGFGTSIVSAAKVGQIITNGYIGRVLAGTIASIGASVGVSIEGPKIGLTHTEEAVANIAIGLITGKVAENIVESGKESVSVNSEGSSKIVDDVIGDSRSNKYSLSGEEHFEAYKEMFGKENVEWVSKPIDTPDYVKLSNNLEDKLTSDGYVILDTETAEKANTDWFRKGYTNPPIAENTTAFKVEAGNAHYVRTYNTDWDNYNGKWIMRYEDIEGLTGAEIAEKYAMPTPPDMICDVNLPSDAPLEVSITGMQPNMGEGLGGDIEYGIKDIETSEDWFVNKHPLE